MSTCGIRSPPTDGKLRHIPEDVTEIRQCRPLWFEWDTTVDLPASVCGFIADGDTFRIPITDGRPSNDSLRWECNVRGGTRVVFAALTSGEYGNLGYWDPIRVGESEEDGCLRNGSYGASLLADQGNGTMPNTAAVPTATIVGAVVGSVLGVAVVTALIAWYAVRRIRAVRRDYAIDLQDEGVGEPLSAMEALITPLKLNRDRTAGKKPTPQHSEGYTALQLSGAGYADTPEAGPSTWEPEDDADYADAVRKRPPPTYAQVLFVTGPESGPDARADASSGEKGGASLSTGP